MTFDEFIALAGSDARWDGITKLPWGDPAFSERMLREHLSQAHDGASRRAAAIDRHVRWIHDVVLGSQTGRVLDLGCGPGLYTQRLAALGHECVGIDISPAAIAYARSNASASTPPTYVLGDVMEVPFGAGFDLVMMVHGELNVFARDTAAMLLGRMRDAAAPSGRVLLEVHRFESVEAIGRRSRIWYALNRGLFGDRPHLRIDEHRWDAATAQAMSVNWIVDADLQVERFGTSTYAYTPDESESLLAGARLTQARTFPSLDGGDEADPNYIVLVGSA